MNKFIRWQGLLGFSVLLASLIGFWLLAAPTLIQWAIEDVGSKAAGAKVEVGAVNLSFEPLGFELRNLQVADAEQPMMNVFQTGKILAQLELAPLLQGKMVVKSLQVTNLDFAVPRKTSGALSKPAATTPAATGNTAPAPANDEPSLASDIKESLPSASELLAREPLSTVSKGEAFNSSLQQYKLELNSALAATPTKESIKQYKQDLADIKKGGVKNLADFKAKQELLNALKAKLKNDENAISNAKEVLQRSKTDLKNQFAILKKAPTEDFNKLMDKYQFNGEGAANISQLLFGEQFSGWVEQARYWYAKASPYIEKYQQQASEEKETRRRLEGRYVNFPTAHPKAGFMIKDALLSMQLSQGELRATIKDVSSDQQLTKKATTLLIESKELPNIKALTVHGLFDYRTAPAQNRLDLEISDLKVNNYKLGGNDLVLESANTLVDGRLDFVEKTIDLSGTGHFQDAVFISHSSSSYGQAVAKTLARVKDFDVQLLASGPFNRPDVSINSDLDDKVRGAASEQFKAKKAALEQELKAKLNDKLLSYAGPYQQQLEQLHLEEASLDTAKTELKNMLSTELAAFKDGKAKEVQDKMKDKLKEKFGKIKF